MPSKITKNDYTYGLLLDSLHGSGFDSNFTVQIHQHHYEVGGSYHAMDQSGCYCGWVSWTMWVERKTWEIVKDLEFDQEEKALILKSYEKEPEDEDLEDEEGYYAPCFEVIADSFMENHHWMVTCPPRAFVADILDREADRYDPIYSYSNDDEDAPEDLTRVSFFKDPPPAVLEADREDLAMYEMFGQYDHPGCTGEQIKEAVWRKDAYKIEDIRGVNESGDFRGYMSWSVNGLYYLATNFRYDADKTDALASWFNLPVNKDPSKYDTEKLSEWSKLEGYRHHHKWDPDAICGGDFDLPVSAYWFEDRYSHDEFLALRRHSNSGIELQQETPFLIFEAEGGACPDMSLINTFCPECDNILDLDCNEATLYSSGGLKVWDTSKRPSAIRRYDPDTESGPQPVYHEDDSNEIIVFNCKTKVLTCTCGATMYEPTEEVEEKEKQ